MTSFKYSTLIVILFFTFLSYQGLAQNSSDSNWQELFNGEDHSGCHLLNGQHNVEVEDGVIVGTTIHGLPNGFLATKEEFGDFIFELQVKADLLQHNSGI